MLPGPNTSAAVTKAGPSRPEVRRRVDEAVCVIGNPFLRGGHEPTVRSGRASRGSTGAGRGTRYLPEEAVEDALGLSGLGGEAEVAAGGVRARLEPGDVRPGQPGHRRRAGVDREVLGDDAEPVLGHHPRHLRARPHGHGEARLDEVEELVRQGAGGVGVERWDPEDPDVVPVERGGQVSGRDRVVEGDPGEAGRAVAQCAQVASAVAAGHEVQVQGVAPTEGGDDVEHRLEVAAGDRTARVDEPDRRGVDRGGGEVSPRRSVAHHLRPHAVVLGVQVCDRRSHGGRGCAEGQVGAAQVVHERGDEQPPGEHVRALLRRPLVQVRPHRGTGGEPVCHREGAGVVGDDGVPPLALREPQRVLGGRCRQLGGAPAAGGEEGDTAGCLRQGGGSVREAQVLVGPGGRRPVADGRHVRPAGDDGQLPQHPGVAVDRGEGDHEDAGTGRHTVMLAADLDRSVPGGCRDPPRSVRFTCRPMMLRAGRPLGCRPSDGGGAVGRPRHAARGMPDTRRFRPEIEGLRAVAAVLVAVYHIWFAKVSGGVDVFFVIAGFLITTSLLRQVQRTGRLDVGRFLTRLGKRLLPASLTVLAAVLVATRVLMPFTREEATYLEVVASALYLENWALAAKSVDYLARDEPSSPVQHFWAMSIQGQFYLLWIVVFGVALALRRREVQRSLGWVLTVLFAASSAFSVYLTAANQPLAYFHTATRVWELSAGGLLALVSSRVRRMPDAWGALASWVGLAMIVLTGVILPVSDAFPGVVAAWPLAGAVLVLLGSGAQSALGADRLLTIRPLVKVGGIAYGLYLWHWPILTFYLLWSGESHAGFLAGMAILATSFA